MQRSPSTNPLLSGCKQKEENKLCVRVCVCMCERARACVCYV